jgi:hypothetical protein
MFFMHGGAGYTRFIQNIGRLRMVFIFPLDLLIIPKIIPGFSPRVSNFVLGLRLLFLRFIIYVMQPRRDRFFQCMKGYIVFNYYSPRGRRFMD